MDERFQKAGATFTLVFVFFLAGCGSDPTRSRFSDQLGKLVIQGNSTYDFGFVAVGNSAFHTFTVVNEGNGAATDITSSFTLSAFTYKGGSFPGIGGNCPDELEGGESCAIVVEFSPPYPDDFSEPISIRYFDGVDMQSTAEGYVQVQLRGRTLGN